MENLTSWSFADCTRGRVDVSRTHDISYYRPAPAVEPLDSGTTHVSVYSPDGAAVAATSTVNSLYAGRFERCSGAQTRWGGQPPRRTFFDRADASPLPAHFLD